MVLIVEKNITNVFLAEQHHAQAVNADADAAGGRHAVFERDEKIVIDFFVAEPFA